MNIRNAEPKDTTKILELLSQVLEIHAKIRPDIFISGTTKYSKDELCELMSTKHTPIYVAVNEEDEVMGYAFCVVKETNSENMVPYTYIYIDDLCVDQSYRGQHVGEALFNHVCKIAKENGYYEVMLNVWEGNESAKGFYEKMGLKPMKTTMEYIMKK